jgi:S-DNA-T family DNA segregation ATPase FtsK/SpoIIIE
MTVRIPTHELVGLLTDLSLTAADPEVGNATAGVLLHTARGYNGDTPGKTDLLVGTSTDGIVLGHTHVPCSGQADPMLWPIGDVAAVLAVLKPFAKNKDHAVEITREGDVFAVAEDRDLFGEGLTLTFAAADAEEFPPGAWSMLSELAIHPPEGSQPALARTDFVASRIAPFLKIAARRKSMVSWFRWHQRLPVVVEIGPEYRGLISPYAYNDEDRSAGVAPSGDVYPLAVPQ